MGGDRDQREEDETRLEWMIREFQDARRRRLVKTSERGVEPQTEADITARKAPSRQTLPLRGRRNLEHGDSV